MYKIEPKELGHFDIAVCGGGVAGTAAAISAARSGASVAVIEADGCLGGIMTKCNMPYMIDNKNKGGLIREFYTFLDGRNMTCPRRGKRHGEDGKNIRGAIFEFA